MIIREIAATLDAQVLCGTDLSIDIQHACGSDMMSDALAFVKDQAMLLTGLVNPQAIRTAEMLDMHCIAFVRGKQPSQTMLELAQASGIAVLSTRLTMFSACGRLYQAGLRGGNE